MKKEALIWVSLMFFTLGIASLPISNAFSRTWKIWSFGQNTVGGPRSLVLDSQGEPSMSFQDYWTKNLTYTSSTASSTVDSNVASEESPLAFDRNGRPHIVYRQFDVGLKYAFKNDSRWQIEIIDFKGVWPSLVLDTTSHPHVSYSRRYPEGIFYAFKNETAWTIENVVQTGVTTFYPSIALDSNNNPHISAAYGGTLLYSKRIGGSWLLETVESGNISGETSISIDSDNNPHIAYYDAIHGNSKYAMKKDEGWNIEIVSSPGGASPSLSLDSNGNPHISYKSYKGETDFIPKYALKYAEKIGGNWVIETVDADVYSDYTPLALDSQGNPFILYGGTVNNLPYMKLAYGGNLGKLYIYVESKGNSLSEVSVVSTSQPPGQSSLNARTGADGYVRFNNTLAGSYEVQITKNGYKTLIRTIDVTPGLATMDTINLTARGWLGQEWIWLVLVTIIIVIVVTLIFFLRRKRKV